MSVVEAEMENGSTPWTAEQRHAIERRDGDLVLAAGAGSGKTSVLVERFVRSVVDDGIGVGEILTITFTEKAAGEMRERIRARLRELGEEEAASATEGAFIATIHGFCARVLRAGALAAGIDPGFAVLDEHEAAALAGAAFDEALAEISAAGEEAVELIAGYGVGALRSAMVAIHDELRSRGELEPALPPLAPASELAPLSAELERAAAAAAAELGEVENPGVRVQQALERLARCGDVGGAADPWPGDLDALALPRGNGAALSTPVCCAYTEALARLREACGHRRAERAHAWLDQLLRTYSRRYRECKRERSGLDFEDLELLTRELLRRDAGLRERYRARFRRIMVDELQDTNAVQLELIGALADGNLFTVGDAQQSIYAFRHADVELFERLADERRTQDAYATLQVNFRSRPEILAVLNATFGAVWGERFALLEAGRDDAPAPDPRVELLLVDKGADWFDDGLAAPWRIAEARALALRVDELMRGGTAARDIVVLTRATTDLRTYERALEERGVPTYLIGGRGYWGHPQVVDLVSYLRALSNPRDEEALYTVLASPLVGVSLDCLVLVAAAAHADGVDPWSALERSGGDFDGLGEADRGLVRAFVRGFSAERGEVGRRSIEELLDRALERTGYDLAVLALPGGRRRLANVRKLMRLAREHELEHGPELRAFLDVVTERSRAGGAAARESEAPVEGEALDAVRLMTIHRSKGLEFDVVCVADLGRVRRTLWEILRVGRDGRLGLRLAEPGTGKREPALAYRELGDERAAADEAEERRLFYVAMTRARERLVLSGAARLDKWPEANGGTAAGWIVPALVPEFGERFARAAGENGQGAGGEPSGDGACDRGVSERGVSVRILREDASDLARPAPEANRAQAGDDPTEEPATTAGEFSGAAGEATLAPEPLLGGRSKLASEPPLARLSYSALAEYERCGYRFYLERVLGVAAVEREPGRGVVRDPSATSLAVQSSRAPGQGLAADARGRLAHALLERLDFRRPLAPDAGAVTRLATALGTARPSNEEAAELARLVEGFAETELAARLGQATQVRREQRFSFRLGANSMAGADFGDVLMTGALDVVARERGGMLVVDYKTDRLGGESPAAVVAREYAGQRLIYALAVLLDGTERVEVAHVFLERAAEPVVRAYGRDELPALRARLDKLAGGVIRREFEVTPLPHRAVCAGCPAEGGLCSWPPALTRRERPDQLF